jgi:hypothetical protein
MRVSVYDFGRIVVDGEVHTRDVIIYPERVQCPWWRKEGHRLAVEDLGEVWDAAPDVLVVGTGYYGRMAIAEQAAGHARASGIEVVAARTPEAVSAFNSLQSDPNKKVVAALHLTC